MMHRQLRHLFVRILIYCHPNNPEKLWEKLKDSMLQDFKINCNLDEAIRKAYLQIKTFLSNERSDIKNFQTGLQLTEIDITINDRNNDDILLQEHEETAKIQYQKLNQKQKEIIDKVFNIVLKNERMLPTSCFYIDGPGGSEKTFIYSTLYHLLKSNGKTICTIEFTWKNCT